MPSPPQVARDFAYQCSSPVLYDFPPAFLSVTGQNRAGGGVGGSGQGESGGMLSTTFSVDDIFLKSQRTIIVQIFLSTTNFSVDENFSVDDIFLGSMFVIMTPTTPHTRAPGSQKEPYCDVDNRIPNVKRLLEVDNRYPIVNPISSRA